MHLFYVIYLIHQNLHTQKRYIPTGFHADIMILLSSGLFLIKLITLASWSTPQPS